MNTPHKLPNATTPRTLTQVLEDAMIARGWTDAEREGWQADETLGIKPRYDSCRDGKRRRSLTFRLSTVVPDGTRVHGPSGAVFTIGGLFFRDEAGVGVAHIMPALRLYSDTAEPASRDSDRLMVVTEVSR